MSRTAILVPVFNAHDALHRTLQSLDDQNGDFEVYVVDDGSEPPVELQASRHRHRVHLISLSPHQGVVEARNRGLKAILEGDYTYVALQDAGDLDVNERLATQTAFLDNNPEVALVGAWAEHVDLAGNTLYVERPPANSDDIRRRMRYVSAFVNPSCMIRTQALRGIRLYDPDFPIASDYELLFRISRRSPCANIQRVLIVKEENPNSLSFARRRRSVYYRLKVQMRHFTPTSIDAYLGILYNLPMLVLPYWMVLAVKRRQQSEQRVTKPQ